VFDLESWKSLNMVNLMIALDAEFEVRLAVDEAADLLSVPLVTGIFARKARADVMGGSTMP